MNIASRGCPKCKYGRVLAKDADEKRRTQKSDYKLSILDGLCDLSVKF